VTATLGIDLVFQVKPSDPDVCVLLDGASCMKSITVTSVCIRNQWQIDD
jgi:hypothetical protein